MSGAIALWGGYWSDSQLASKRPRAHDLRLPPSPSCTSPTAGVVVLLVIGEQIGRHAVRAGALAPQDVLLGVGGRVLVHRTDSLLGQPLP